jgi:hypothetical protein
MKLYKLVSSCVAVVLVLAVWAVSASAYNVTLTDSNSLLKYDTTYGAVTWNVDGTDNLFYESYFYRVGTGAAMELTGGYNSAPIGTDNNKYGTTYNLGAYGRVRLTQTLSGGATGSQMSQWITSLDFTPGGEGTEPLYFYSYSDYHLSDTAADETASYLGSGEFSQYDDLTQLLWSTVIFPSGSPYLPDYYTTRGWITDPDGVPNEASGDLNNNGYYYGNAIFMTQWNDPLDFHIFRSLTPVPEPSTFLLLGGGLAGLALFARRRKKE